ncbi:tRNA (guanine(9)-N1)-methyltransferase-like isoform X1 [Zingiber officinale]|uniref:tRNA (guanine(9)-N1)-methyltransferase-like isoform X1 n=1 Tax=Zingiber officinale TaxID=94328 RepID=UPI001C4D03CF|nr:tRNA (guanine(9)-N1)-methyltransferase-like isoform X1 [Zingiber officinale]
MDEAGTEGQIPAPASIVPDSDSVPVLSKRARKKQAKQQRLEARKAERKKAEKDRRRQGVERRRQEWEEKLASATEEERERLIGERRETRRERVERRAEDRELRAERLKRAAELGIKVVLDLEFADLMKPNELHSLVQQIMYCYAVNGRCASPAHLWLTGCQGEIDTSLQRIPGYDKWIIEKENRSYIEVFQEHKENIVYLTADSETILEEIDPKKIYIIGGLVDRNRWKGITMNKANDQGINSAKLPIGNYLKMSSSQVLTVNQVFEILLKFMETRDWKEAFFQVIPQRKMGDLEAQDQTDVAYYDETLSTSIARRSENEGEKDVEQAGSISKKPRLVDVQSGGAITVDGGGPKD